MTAVARLRSCVLCAVLAFLVLPAAAAQAADTAAAPSEPASRSEPAQTPSEDAVRTNAFSFTYKLGRNTGTGFEPFRNTSQYLITYDTADAAFRTGWQQTEETFDFTADGVWWWYSNPTRKGYVRQLGLGGLYHYFLWHKMSAANDFQAGVFMKVQPFKYLIIDGDLDVQLKLEQVFAIKRTTPWLKNWNPALRLRLTAVPVPALNLYFETASYEYFRYMLFFSPAYTFGGMYTWSNGIYAGCELTARYTDQFTMSAYFDCAEARAFIGCRF